MLHQWILFLTTAFPRRRGTLPSCHQAQAATSQMISGVTQTFAAGTTQRASMRSNKGEGIIPLKAAIKSFLAAASSLRCSETVQVRQVQGCAPNCLCSCLVMLVSCSIAFCCAKNMGKVKNILFVRLNLMVLFIFTNSDHFVLEFRATHHSDIFFVVKHFLKLFLITQVFLLHFAITAYLIS